MSANGENEPLTVCGRERLFAGASRTLGLLFGADDKNRTWRLADDGFGDTAD